MTKPSVLATQTVSATLIYQEKGGRMIEQGPHYPVTSKKKDTTNTDVDPYGLIDLRRSFKEKNLHILQDIAFKHGLLVRVVPPLEGEEVDEGEIFIQTEPLFGTKLPDWDGLWAEYERLRKKKK